MFLKNKTVRYVLCALLALLILYTGACGIATWHKASTQPYLLAGTVRYDFQGFYMLTKIDGALCAAAILALVHVIRRTGKRN